MKAITVVTKQLTIACSALLLLVFVSSFSHAGDKQDEKKIATFNTESGADIHWFHVAKSIRDARKIDVWVLQEVESHAVAARYTEAAAAWGRDSYRYVVSESGINSSPSRSNDHLVTICVRL